MKKLALVIPLLMLAGCETMRPYPAKPQPEWYKSGISAYETQSKLAKCRYDVGMNKVEMTEMKTLIVSCMQADGFRFGVSPEKQKAWEDQVESLQKQGYRLY